MLTMGCLAVKESEGIKWRRMSWNPVTGCTKYSLGCKNCYAERLAKRLKDLGVKKYRNGFEVTLHPDVISKPLKIRRSTIIFVVSMGDLFHEKVPDDYILDVFKVMNKAQWHIFQLLTKRIERAVALREKLCWTPNIWMGVTVEEKRYVYRLDLLREIPAAVKFVSMEPLLGDMPSLNLSNINWVIVGGESGPNCRILKREWVKNVRDQCVNQRVKFYFHQWGGINRYRNGRSFEGRTWNETPSPFVYANTPLFNCN